MYCAAQLNNILALAKSPHLNLCYAYLHVESDTMTSNQKWLVLFEEMANSNYTLTDKTFEDFAMAGFSFDRDDMTGLCPPCWSHASAHCVRLSPSVRVSLSTLRARCISLLRIFEQAAMTSPSMPNCLCLDRNRASFSSRCRSSGGTEVSVSKTGIGVAR
jgi:sarcosine oxidase delta subunit